VGKAEVIVEVVEHRHSEECKEGVAVEEDAGGK
jgi:hypothetical protein